MHEMSIWRKIDLNLKTNRSVFSFKNINTHVRKLEILRLWMLLSRKKQ